MLHQMWTVLTQRSGFFMSLALEHLEISLIAIFIAIIFGGIVGILISEYQRYAKPALGLINSFDRPPGIGHGFCSWICRTKDESKGQESQKGKQEFIAPYAFGSGSPCSRNLFRAGKEGHHSHRDQTDDGTVCPGGDAVPSH